MHIKLKPFLLSLLLFVYNLVCRSSSFPSQTVSGEPPLRPDPGFGLFLESVNGVAGSVHEQTYWEILSENSGECRRIDLGEFHPQSHNAAHLRKQLMRDNELGELASQMSSKEVTINVYSFTYLLMYCWLYKPNAN